MYPHKEKINNLLSSKKLPSVDKKRVVDLLKRYEKFLEDLNSISRIKTEEDLKKFTDIMNDYKFYLDFHFIFESPEDFLYRQQGQLKIQSSFMEELLIHLFRKAFPHFEKQGFMLGPAKSLLRIYFLANFDNLGTGGHITLKEKDIDFAISKQIYIRTSFQEAFSTWEEKKSSLSFIAFECKTNLDKTMFQEIIASASELKSLLPSAKYFVICEWLDMKPISTLATPIDEVIILRGKRLSQRERELFSSKDERIRKKNFYRNHLRKNPIRYKSLLRIIEHIKRALEALEGVDENNVIERGYF